MLKGTSLSGSSQWELDPGLSIYKVLLQKCPAVLVLCFLPGSNLMIFFGAEMVREKMFRVMGWPQSTRQNLHWSPDAFFSYLSRARTITSIGLIWKTLIEPSGNPSVNVAWSYWVDAEQGANTGDTNTEGDENWERRRIKIRRKNAIRIRMSFWLKTPLIIHFHFLNIIQEMFIIIYRALFLEYVYWGNSCPQSTSEKVMNLYIKKNHSFKKMLMLGYKVTFIMMLNALYIQHLCPPDKWCRRIKAKPNPNQNKKNKSLCKLRWEYLLKDC